MELRPQAWQVLIAIGGHIGRDGWAYPSLTRIATLTGIGRKNIPRLITILEDTGLLHRDRSIGGRGNPTRYEIVFTGTGNVVSQRGRFSEKQPRPGAMFFRETTSSEEVVLSPKRPPKTPETSSPEEDQNRKNKQSARVACALEGLFINFWNCCPPRDGSNPKEPARQAFYAAVKSGVDPVRIIERMEAYSRYVANIDNRRYVKQAVTWLKQKGWEDECPEPAPPVRKRVGIF
jgi:hypothetical protein